MNETSIPGIKLLDMGKPGSGKTYGLRTIPPEFQVFVLFLEQSQSLVSDLPHFHYHYISPMGKADWSTLRTIGLSINRMDNAQLQSAAVGGRNNFTQWLEMIDVLNSFVDDKTGENFGDACTWNTDRVLVIDGLTGVSKMSRSLQAGLRPLLTQPDYGVIMQNIQTFLDFLTSNLKCHLILVSHLEMEKDETSGEIHKMVSTIGRKLAPNIPGLFDDAVISEQEGGKFSWRTIATKASTKARLLPLKENMPHDYGVVFAAWRARGGRIMATPTTPQTR